MEKIVMFQPALAPYRVDLINELSLTFKVVLILARNNVENQKFNQASLLNSLNKNIKVEYAYSIRLKKRALLLNAFLKLVINRPNYIVTYEFGSSSISALLYKLVVPRAKWHLMTDESESILRTKSWLWFFLRKWFYTSSLDGMITATSSAAEIFKQKLVYNKVFVLPILFNPLTLNRQQIPLSHIKLDRSNFLFVGRLDREKNVEYLISEFSSCDESNFRLWIVGDGAERPYLEALADGDKRIMFIGRLEGAELYSYYSHCDTLILPSLHEPFGSVVAEALTLGCFVLVSKFVGAKELINNQAGLVFDPEVAGDLRLKLKEVAMWKPTGSKNSLLNESFSSVINRFKVWLLHDEIP